MSADTVDALIEEMTKLIQRAIALGEQQAISRVMTALGSENPGRAVVATEQRHTSAVIVNSPASAVSNIRTIAKGARAPAGSIKSAAKKIVNECSDGISFGQITESAESQLGFEVKSSSLRMALRSLEDDRVVERRGDKWFPTSHDAGESDAGASDLEGISSDTWRLGS